jgi:Flp pilus assembly protein CpaB
MAYRARNILIAVALAIVAALLTGFYVTNYKRHVQRGEDQVTVLVAKHDIPVGTAGSDAASMMAPTQVPRRSVVPGAISSPTEVKNLVATQETFAGEQVTTQRFSSVSQTGIEGQLRGTGRAFSIEGDTNQLLAGTLKDGDHVDFVAALKVPGNQELYLSRVLIRDLKVLQAPPAPSTGSKLTSNGAGNTSVMLAMTDNQAQKVQYALANAAGAGPDRWHLELRPVTRAADSSDHFDSFGSVVSDGLSAGQRRALGR